MDSAIRFIVTLLITVTLAQFADAQRVVVVDESTDEPVDRVALYNQDKSESTITDDFGKADIGMFKDSDSIYFQHPSYETAAVLKHELTYGNNRIMMVRRNIMMEEFVISAVKDREKVSDIPFRVEVLEAVQLNTALSQTGADILISTGNIMVQKSQGGGGSPNLRGFEANKILLVIDGVRMNNAIYRNGHLQNAITIDNNILDRVEVLFGPSSIMYGSDALGGVIHYYTRDPEYNRKELGFYSQFSSANRAKVLHADYSIGGKKIANISSFTFRDFKDIHGGRNRPSSIGDWGLLKHYVKQAGGIDSTMANPSPHIQKNSSYRQYDFVSKTRYSPVNFIDLYMNLQLSASSDIDRYDQLNDYDGDNLKYAEWYYGPQNRFLASLRGVFKNYNPLYTNGTLTLAFQKIREDRISRRFRVDERLFQEEDVYVYSGNLDFTRVMKEGRRLYYGIEFTHNDVNSEARYENIRTGAVQDTLTRYPGGGSHTNSFAIYGNYKIIPSRKTVLHAGIRYQYGMLRSFFSDVNLPYDEIRINRGSPTASLSLVYTPAPTWQYDFILSSGFRIPNVDDYGKVRAKGDYVTVPNENLKPEYTYNAEIGISKLVPGIATFSGSVFFNYLTNAIVRTGHTLNGSDTLLYDGEYYHIISNTNASLGTIQGITLSTRSDIPGNFRFVGTFNYLKGRDITNDVPLGHIPPVFGKVSVSWFHSAYRPDGSSKFTSEAYIHYSGKKYWSDMSPYGEDNQEEAIEGEGYPAWYTLNLRSHYRINERYEIQLAIENLLDRFYKTFASGIGAPGRNIILTFRATI